MKKKEDEERFIRDKNLKKKKEAVHMCLFVCVFVYEKELRKESLLNIQKNHTNRIDRFLHA